MLPKHLRYEPEPEFNTGLVGVPVDVVPGANEDSNGSNNNSNEKVRNYRFLSIILVLSLVSIYPKVLRTTNST